MQKPDENDFLRTYLFRTNRKKPNTVKVNNMNLMKKKEKTMSSNYNISHTDTGKNQFSSRIFERGGMVYAKLDGFR